MCFRRAFFGSLVKNSFINILGKGEVGRGGEIVYHMVCKESRLSVAVPILSSTRLSVIYVYAPGEIPQLKVSLQGDPQPLQGTVGFLTDCNLYTLIAVVITVKSIYLLKGPYCYPVPL